MTGPGPVATHLLAPPALALAALVAAGPDPHVPKPVVTAVLARSDTIWFAGTRGTDSTGVAYCYVPRHRSWCGPVAGGAERLRGASILATRPHVPGDAADTVPLTARLALTWSAPGADERGDAIVVERGGSAHWPVLPARPAPPTTPDDAAPDAPARPSAWAIRDDVLWVGLAGWSSEGMSETGGLVRHDLRAHTSRMVAYPLLETATITALAVDGDALWIGTEHPAEYGSYGDAGLLRFEPASGHWRRWATGNAPLPGDLIRLVAVAAGHVYVATGDGLAVFEPEHDRWSVRWFDLGLDGDSIVHRLAEHRPEREREGELEADLLLMESLGVVRRAAFVDSLAGARADRTTPDRADDPLARRALVPFLLDALRPDVPGRSAAAAALAALGDGRAIPRLRTALAADDSAADANARDGIPRAYVVESATVDVAAALARLGAPEGVRWLRARAAEAIGASSSDPDAWLPPATLEAVRALGTVRDTASIPVRLRMLGIPSLRDAAAQSLADHGTLPVWRRMVAHAAADTGAVATVLRVADSSAVRDSSVRASIGTLAVAALRDADAMTRAAAVRVAVLTRDARAVPVLISLVADDDAADTDLHLLSEALVRLTGEHQAPVPVWSDEGSAPRVARFWQAWWSARGAGPFVPVPAPVGAAAHDRWLERMLDGHR